MRDRVEAERTDRHPQRRGGDGADPGGLLRLQRLAGNAAVAGAIAAGVQREQREDAQPVAQRMQSKAEDEEIPE